MRPSRRARHGWRSSGFNARAGPRWMAADDRIANAIIEYWYTRLRLHVALLFVLCAAPRVSCTRVSPAAQVFSNDTAFKGTNSDCEGYIFAAEFLQRRVGDGVCDFSNSHSLAELLQLDPSKVRTKYLAASKWSQAFCVFGQKARGGGGQPPALGNCLIVHRVKSYIHFSQHRWHHLQRCEPDILPCRNAIVDAFHHVSPALYRPVCVWVREILLVGSKNLL